MKVLLLQHHLSSGPAYLYEPAARHDAVFDARMPHLETDHMLPDDDSGFDAYMLMGGIMNAGDVAEFPWLDQAAELVRLFTAAEKPVPDAIRPSPAKLSKTIRARLFQLPIR